jgi:hypothetical protein
MADRRRNRVSSKRTTLIFITMAALTIAVVLAVTVFKGCQQPTSGALQERTAPAPIPQPTSMLPAPLPFVLT